MQADLKAPILQAYADGKDFLFVIENPKLDAIVPIQFYFHQPEPPGDKETGGGGLKKLYYPSPPSWYEHWGPENNLIGLPIERSKSGFVGELDLGFPGHNSTIQTIEQRIGSGDLLSLERHGTEPGGIPPMYRISKRASS